LLFVIVADRLTSVLTEMQCLENRLRSNSTVYRIVDSPEQLLLCDYIDGERNQNCTSLSVSELLNSVISARAEMGVGKSRKQTVDEHELVQVSTKFII